jgi:hypothetical protein
MVIEDDEIPSVGWIVEGSLDVVDGGNVAYRGVRWRHHGSGAGRKS